MRSVVLRTSLLALLWVVLGAGPAAAHASLVGSDPEDGSTHATAPATITLTFSENIGSPAYIAVTAPDGSTVKVSTARALDNIVSTSVTDVDMKGSYTAAYRVVSADGHPVDGTFHYTVTAGRTVTQAPREEQDAFLHRHSTHLIWGILAAIVAIALLLAPLRRRGDEDSA